MMLKEEVIGDAVQALAFQNSRELLGNWQK